MTSDQGMKTPRRKRWESPSVEDVGHVGDVLQVGGGKLSPSPHDPGETFKPPGQDK